MNTYLLKVNSVQLSSAKHICPNSWLLIATLIFSACYYSAPNSFFFIRRTFFRFTILPLFQHFALNLFDSFRLVSLFSHSAKSEFEHQLPSKAIQNKQS